MKRLLTLSVLTILLISPGAYAQFEVGASYELRDEDPKSGFGLRVQRDILGKLPLVDIGLRAHFSYFNDENEVSRSGGVTYSEDFTNYDFGLAAYGGASVGLLHPYVGVGLGSETTDLDIQDFNGVGSPPEEGDESNIYWNTFVGAKVTVIPLLKPFVEYRYSNKELSKPTLAEAQNGRIIFGVLLSF